ncbi:d-arabinitol 2-dehydrogenase [Trichoderma cornu-damae]|uniref:D-arabinitol 2-dehydrogenase n=1 Tax=Trichoderma cornu-damae TaxID=654480 RepID=A0A9P8QE50_9HYPO|nr:d-arabinitol 2-dehydrogenase [Trichoderma cornu-damae]
MYNISYAIKIPIDFAIMGSTESNPDCTIDNASTQTLFSLKDRTIIVTGATGGLGSQITRAILESGGDVIGIDRDEIPPAAIWGEHTAQFLPSPSARTKQRPAYTHAHARAHAPLLNTEPLQTLAKSFSCRLTYRPCDITSQSLTATVFEEAASDARYPLRGLVNCAGIGMVGDSIDYSEDLTKRTLDVNLAGSLYVAQAAAKVVRRQHQEGSSQGGASFVLVASMSGYITNKQSRHHHRSNRIFAQATPTAIYSASKAGVHQLTRSLAGEWGSSASPSAPTIRVNSISPGVIQTPMTKDVLSRQDWASVWEQEAMLKRISRPEEYRGAVVFLLGDASSYVTGVDLRVDGGSTAW